MVISPKYKYLFVELQNTASSSISSELLLHYDGVKILRKHAYYHEFLKIASNEEKNYFVFSCIKNPLDVAVTAYFKYKTNHRKLFTDPKSWVKNGGHVSDDSLRIFNYIRNTNADFPTYLKKFHRLVYNDWSSLAHKQFDFIIRFEKLDSDFKKVLELLGITQKRPLPLINKTDRDRDFLAYYSPDTYKHAKTIFGPYMKKWGYDFPAEWNVYDVPWLSKIQYYVLDIYRRRVIWRSTT